MIYGATSVLGRGVDLLETYKSYANSDWPLDVYGGVTMVRPLEELEKMPYQDKSVWVKWPQELLPIGDSGGNDVICLALTGPRKGHVFYLLNNPSAGRKNIYDIANSFDDFVNSLYLPDER